jgi:hypothetical protein
LEEIAKVAESSGIKPPAIFVIGQVVAYAEALESPEMRPLRDARLAMFAPRSELSEALQDAGAEVLLAPMPLTPAARLVIGLAPLSGWIVQSVRELDALDCEKAARGTVTKVTLWCMGAALADLARKRNWQAVMQLGGEGASPNPLTTLLEYLEVRAYT